MEFILGCNYWASNAGTEMWQNFEPDTIKKDLAVLSEHGIKYLRVFPVWRDFQPVTPLIGAQGRISEYAQNGKEPENKYYLFGKEGCKQLAENLNVPLLGQIPIVQSICEGGDKGTPVALDENTVTGRAFLQLAAAVVRQVDRRNIEMAPTRIVEVHK